MRSPKTAARILNESHTQRQTKLLDLMVAGMVLRELAKKMILEEDHRAALHAQLLGWPQGDYAEAPSPDHKVAIELERIVATLTRIQEEGL